MIDRNKAVKLNIQKLLSDDMNRAILEFIHTEGQNPIHQAYDKSVSRHKQRKRAYLKKKKDLWETRSFRLLLKHILFARPGRYVHSYEKTTYCGRPIKTYVSRESVHDHLYFMGWNEIVARIDALHKAGLIYIHPEFVVSNEYSDIYRDRLRVTLLYKSQRRNGRL